MSSTDTAAAPVDYRSVQARDAFRTLRRTHRSFVFPMTVFFLIWYLTYVVLGAFRPDLFAIPVLGNINLGVAFGLAQFVTTFAITGLYVWFTNNRLDPKSSVIREELEAAGVGLPDETPDEVVTAQAQAQQESDVETSAAANPYVDEAAEAKEAVR